MELVVRMRICIYLNHRSFERNGCTVACLNFFLRFQRYFEKRYYKVKKEKEKYFDWYFNYRSRWATYILILIIKRGEGKQRDEDDIFAGAN